MLCSSVVESAYVGQTEFQTVEVMQTGSFGWCLVLDNKVQSADADEFIYHEAIVHPAMISHPNPRSVFIGGGGEGAVAREVLKYSDVELVTMVDIDREVVDLSRKYLPQRHQGAFDDERLQVITADARKYLQETTSSFDVVILDLADPVEEGPAYLLYTKKFYQEVLERLTPQGVVVVQAGNCNAILYSEVFTVICNTMKTVFPSIHPYYCSVPAFGGMWGFVLGSKGPDPTAWDPPEVDQLLRSRCSGELLFYDGVTHRGMFSLPKYLRYAIDADDRVITEETPVFVY
jgi:spermidine synthase